MTRRKNVKIVVGFWGEHALADLWSRMTSEIDVEFLVLQSSNDQKITTNLPVVIFPEVPEMQGYYRDMESYLLGADLVVAIESSRLASFQTLRCAKSMNIPCIVLTHEFTPFIYDKFPNIKAIKFDITQNADHFLSSSHRASRLLISEGVSVDRITRISPGFDFGADGYKSQKREKFRNYIGLTIENMLVVGRCSFEHTEAASAILKGFRGLLVRKSREDVLKTKLLLVGEGSRLEELKYEASDLGIGAQVIFLAQDSSPFWRDLANAADVIIWDRWRDRVTSESYPFSFAHAVATGVDCVIPMGTIFDEIAGEASITRVHEFSPLEITDILSGLVTTRPEIADRRTKNLLSFANLVHESKTTLQILNVIEKLTLLSQGPSAREKVQQFVNQNKDPISRKQAKELYVKVEELLLITNMDNSLQAELWRIKGDVFASLSDSERAVPAYEKAIQIDETCFRANRGLGYLAWLGHSHEDAMTFFKKALAAEHNDYHSLVGVGLIYRRLKMLDESVFWLGRAVDIGGAESASLNLIIQACLEAAEAAVSLSTLEQLRESFGDLPQIIRGLSQVYLAQGMLEKAAPLLEQSCA